ncbi:MAG TPA: hypothetical protein VFW62_12900 [bacterium]|nr:hypothetical protein [bacterium]
MNQVPKETTRVHFKVLYRELERLETNCKILQQWAEDRRLVPAKTLALLIGDALESLELHLSDFRHLLEEESGEKGNP